MHSISCCSCSLEHEIIRIGQSSHKTYSNNIVNFQESTTILNTHTKKVSKLIVGASYILLYTMITLMRYLTQRFHFMFNKLCLIDVQDQRYDYQGLVRRNIHRLHTKIVNNHVCWTFSFCAVVSLNNLLIYFKGIQNRRKFIYALRLGNYHYYIFIFLYTCFLNQFINFFRHL